jgi:hypothetical protein
MVFPAPDGVSGHVRTELTLQCWRTGLKVVRNSEKNLKFEVTCLKKRSCNGNGMLEWRELTRKEIGKWMKQKPT